MFMKLVMALVVFGVVAFLVGTLTVPEFGETNPRVRILAAISVAKSHREALSGACARGTLKTGLQPEALGLGAPLSYAANFRSRVDIEVADPRSALVIVRLKSIGESTPDNAAVVYTGTCTDAAMSWVRSTSPPGLLPEKKPAG